jgi:glycosyltransferase involved in cell wall biosynthesis
VIYDLDSSIPDQLEYSGAVRSRAILSMARAAERFAVRRSQLAITVCQALTDRVLECAPSYDVVQIEDAPLAESLRAPDPATVAALRARHGDGPFALYTGNLASYQGVDLLLDGIATLRRLAPTARVLIVGGEPDEIERARATLHSRDLADAVVFAGKEPPTLMADYMALATVLVSPRRDGSNTPLKLYTYMSSGVPIVATDIESHRQVLDDSTAVLCAPEPHALAHGLASVVNDPAAFAPRAAAARARVEERYSPAVFERKLLAAYDALLAPARTRRA